HLHPARLPQARVVEHEVGRERRERRGIGKHARVEIHVRLGDAELVAPRRRQHPSDVLAGVLAQDLGRALGHLLEHARGLFGVRGSGLEFHHCSFFKDEKRATPSLSTTLASLSSYCRQCRWAIASPMAKKIWLLSSLRRNSTSSTSEAVRGAALHALSSSARRSA